MTSSRFHPAPALPWHPDKKLVVLLFLACLFILTPMTASDRSTATPDFTFGNASFYNLNEGDTISYMGKEISLSGIDKQFSEFKIENKVVRLKVSKLSTPTIVEGLRIYLADNAYVKSLTNSERIHGLLVKDALISVSDASSPLLNPNRYAFPISTQDGYEWKLGESSHMFAYLGPRWNDRTRFRAHEGIDFDMHDGRGIEKHPVVAVEDGDVEWALRELGGDQNEGSVLIRSASQPNIYYVYKHLYSKLMFVNDGDTVRKGDTIGYIWGDGIWGHLHFSIVFRDTTPAYHDRYTNSINMFPQMYELWTGSSQGTHLPRTEGSFDFGRIKGESGNIRYNLAYSPVLGYGWEIDDWCPAEVLEAIPYESDKGFIFLKKTSHEGSRAEAVNPRDHFEFVVDVEDGVYAVSLLVGDYYNESYQRVEVQGTDFGTFDLEEAVVEWTDEKQVSVEGGKLRVRIYYKEDRGAALCHLKFARQG